MQEVRDNRGNIHGILHPMMPPLEECSMQCYVYASQRKAGTYVWLRQHDTFDALPAALLEKLGELRFVLEVDLTADRQLPHENAAAILASIDTQGWYLQLPPADTRHPASI